MNNKILIAVVIIAVIIIGGIAVNRNRSKSNDSAKNEPGGNSQVATPSANNTVKTIEVTGSEFAFSPNLITVNKGETVKINFTNNGNHPHNLAIKEFNAKTATIPAGQTADVTFVADKAGTFEFNCDVPGHSEKGMVGQLIVQ